MKCTNKSCIASSKGIDIEKSVLRLRDGNMACPYCGETVLASEAAFSFESGQEEYELAESLYFEYITSQIKDDRKIELCEQLLEQANPSANPRAAILMGKLYDNDLTGVNSDEENRCKIALRYYKSVCDGMLSHEEAGEADDFANLQKQAAVLIEIMLYNFGAFEGELSYSTNIGHLLEQNLLTRNQVRRLSKQGEDKGNGSATTFKKLLARCCDPKRQDKNMPLFGVFKMDVQDFIAAFSDDEEGDILEKAIRNKITLVNVYWDYDLGMASKAASRSANDLREKAEELKEQEDARVIIYFFNLFSKHKIFMNDVRAGELKKFENNLRNNYWSGLFKSRDFGDVAASMVIYDDDLTASSLRRSNKKLNDKAIEAMLEDI